MLSFIREYVRWWTASDSAVGTVIKLALLAAVVVVPRWTLDQPIRGIVSIPGLEIISLPEVSIGAALSGLVLTVWGLIGFGVAGTYFRSPRIRVMTTLENDDEHKTIRLPIALLGRREASPAAEITFLESQDGQKHDTIVPIPLSWMHATPGNVPRLCYRDRAKVNVAHVLDPGGPSERLVFGNDNYQRHIKMRSATGERLGATFGVRVTLMGTTREYRRRFALLPDANAFLGVTSQYLGSRCPYRADSFKSSALFGRRPSARSTFRRCVVRKLG